MEALKYTPLQMPHNHGLQFRRQEVDAWVPLIALVNMPLLSLVCSLLTVSPSERDFERLWVSAVVL